MPIIAKGISRRNGIAFYSHTGIAGGLLKSTITEPMAKSMQQIMFMKNLSMLGAAMLITHFGSGPLSMDDKTH